jgi:molecular chaperone GrpE
MGEACSDDDADEAPDPAPEDVDEPAEAPPVPRARVGELEERVDALEAERDELADRVEELEAENEELTDRVARARADLQNYKKRADREKQEAARDARVEMVEILAGASDNVQRAMDADPSPDVERGLELVQRTIEEELAAVGVERLAPEPGDAFDPTEHEAVVTEPTGEHEPETVIERLAPGYELDGRQIRAAQVKVAAAPADE